MIGVENQIAISVIHNTITNPSTVVIHTATFAIHTDFHEQASQTGLENHSFRRYVNV